MAEFRCWNEDCIHNKENQCTCSLGVINIGGDFPYGCGEYLCYLNTQRYSEQYFIAKCEGNGLPRHRVKKYGRKIEFKGFIFFTQSYNSQDDKMQYRLTESRTGYYCGLLKDLQKPEMWQKFIEGIKTIPNVMDLPLAEIQDGKYVIVKEEEQE